jgi:hypothetical protein
MQYTFFSAAHGTFSKIGHILGHKAALKIQENRSNPLYHIRSQQNKTTAQQQNKHRKYSNTWKLKNTLLIKQWVPEEIRDDIKRFLESNENEIQPIKICGTQQRLH